MTKTVSKNVENNQDVKTSAEPDELSGSHNTRHWPFDNGSFAPFHNLRREVDGIFNQFTDRFGVFDRGSIGRLQNPAMDVSESETSFEIVAELPGIDEQDIEVEVTDNILTIHGEKFQKRDEENADTRISECNYGVFERSLSLPFQCDASSIEAEYANGVLRLSIPKPAQTKSKPQKIAIKSAA